MKYLLEYHYETNMFTEIFTIFNVTIEIVNLKIRKLNQYKYKYTEGKVEGRGRRGIAGIGVVGLVWSLWENRLLKI